MAAHSSEGDSVGLEVPEGTLVSGLEASRSKDRTGLLVQRCLILPSLNRVPLSSMTPKRPNLLDHEGHEELLVRE